MDLNHTFTVPASKAETWAAFEDIESVAGCFPGATVTSVDGDDFTGSCKVKLGPVALTYNGSGTFVEKDESAGRFVVEAKGKDKRGNGTAGATVTASFTEEDGSTRVDVATDLSITGRPAQFGRGVIQDVSDKLLQQFVACLQSKVGSGADAAAAAPAEAPSAVDAPGAVPPPAGPGEAATAPARPTPTAQQAPTAAPTAGPSAAPGEVSEAAPATGRAGQPGQPGESDALDLGATVLPVLVRSYGRQLAGGLVVLLVLYLLGRRMRRR